MLIYLVENLVNAEDVEGRREGEGRRAVEEGGGGGDGGWRREAGGECVGEAGGDALHGVTDGGDDAVQVVEVPAGGEVVVFCDRLRAGQQEVHQLEPAVLLLQCHGRHTELLLSVKYKSTY